MSLWISLNTKQIKKILVNLCIKSLNAKFAKFYAKKRIGNLNHKAHKKSTRTTKKSAIIRSICFIRVLKKYYYFKRCLAAWKTLREYFMNYYVSNFTQKSEMSLWISLNTKQIKKISVNLCVKSLTTMGTRKA